MSVVVAGASGLIGRALVERLLSQGRGVTVLARRPDRLPPSWNGRIRAVAWGGRGQGPWTAALDGARAVVNLCGENIGQRRWSARRKRELLDSRLDSTGALVEALRSLAGARRRLINASAVGFYGDRPEGNADEDDPPGEGFLARLCARWEASAGEARAFGVSTALARFGIVLAREEGALPRLALPFRFFVGGPIGSGRQWLSWIHRDDAVAALLWLIDHPELEGPFNLASPRPERQGDFALKLGRALRRPSRLPIPGPVLRLALGEMSEALLGGQRAAPRRLLESGFQFAFPGLDEALAQLYR
ncbi:MAG: TIGR01777 family oxidoreductase [Elusimicrobia bacterium]|nr:TIGR01777 family oxidoreductase [Elusimicrobiota bacterium]MDE2236459.1 TIGR01777 family oxidoreductase [Elusimicrobiota bacterium]MDE2424521.1 TIGR01777 family oxidoreductase [Elusimicrobiota bacterium]